MGGVFRVCTVAVLVAFLPLLKRLPRVPLFTLETSTWILFLAGPICCSLLLGANQYQPQVL